MISWPYVPAVGLLVLLSACAERSEFTQADLDRQAALTRCSAQADAQRPLWNARQLHSLPGQPRPLSLDWRNEVNRKIAECLANRRLLHGRALDVP